MFKLFGMALLFSVSVNANPLGHFKLDATGGGCANNPATVLPWSYEISMMDKNTLVGTVVRYDGSTKVLSVRFKDGKWTGNLGDESISAQIKYYGSDKIYALEMSHHNETTLRRVYSYDISTSSQRLLIGETGGPSGNGFEIEYTHLYPYQGSEERQIFNLTYYGSGRQWETLRKGADEGSFEGTLNRGVCDYPKLSLIGSGALSPSEIDVDPLVSLIALLVPFKDFYDSH